MFSRRERLSRTQFPTALKSGRRISSEHFMLVVPKEARGYAVVIPKKIIRLSSARHLLKRRILEALRSFPLPSSLIIFSKSQASGVKYKDIEKELGELISNIRS